MTAILTLLAAAAIGVILGVGFSRILRKHRDARGEAGASMGIPRAVEPPLPPPSPAGVSGETRVTEPGHPAPAPRKGETGKKSVPEPPLPPSRASTPEEFREMLSLQAECLEAFREQAGISEGEWRSRESRLFAVSDSFAKRAYYDYLVDYLGPQLGGGGVAQVYEALQTCRFPSGLFEKAVSLIPARERPVKVGAVQTPFDADIHEIRV